MKARGKSPGANRCGEPLGADYFCGTPTTCARGLIGAVFEWGGCAGRIVETEAYAVDGDEACHTASRPSARAFMAAHGPGTAYVYLNYGVHWLFNVLVKGGGEEGFVLFRALEPVDGIATMAARRPKCRKQRDFCSGPGKLTRALGIDGTAHGCSFLNQAETGIRQKTTISAVMAGPRIGISRAQERPWRFFAPESPCLSAPAGHMDPSPLA